MARTKQQSEKAQMGLLLGWLRLEGLELPRRLCKNQPMNPSYPEKEKLETRNCCTERNVMISEEYRIINKKASISKTGV